MPYMKIVTKASSGGGQGASYFQQWLYSVDGVPGDGPALCTALRNQINTYLQPVLSNLWSVTRFDYTYYPGLDQEPLPTQVTSQAAVTGAIAVDALPSRMTMLVEFKSYSTKPNRKRCYVGRYGESGNDTTGVPTGAVVAAVQAWADHSIGSQNVNGHAWQYGVARSGIDVSRIIAFNSFTSHLVQTKWAFLRSRDGGRGI